MASSHGSDDLPARESHEGQESFEEPVQPAKSRWRDYLNYIKSHRQLTNSDSSLKPALEKDMKPARWSLGILNDRETEQVPGKPQFSFMAREEQLREFSSACLHRFDHLL